MSKKSISIILSLAIIAAFFLPYLSDGSESFSGMNIIFGNAEFEGLHRSGSNLLVSLLIPLGALFILIGAFSNDSFTSMGIVRWLPLIGVVYLVVMLYIRATSGDVGDTSIGEFIAIFAYGFWITLVASVVLLFTKS
jgi:hypothetical protein